MRLRSGVLAIGVATLFTFLGCISAAVTLGTHAAGGVAAGAVLIALLVALATRTAAFTAVVRAPYHGPSSAPRSFPRYDKLLATLDWSMRDRRYYERTCMPLLRDVALDLEHAADPQSRIRELRRAVGEQSWRLLEPAPGQAGSFTQTAPPDGRDLSALLDALENLERSWT